METSLNSVPAVQRQSSVPESLKVVEPQTLNDRMEQLNNAIARRAYELFENDRIFGRDLTNWLQAESELLHPAHMRVLESDDSLTVQAEVPGFGVNDLQVSLEPRRVTISGRRESHSDGKTEKSATVYQEQCSSELLRVIDLPAEVDASKATATLRNGILELNMPKVAQVESKQVQVKAAASGS
jgi:HSP20 family molecular chaperone IbpA